MQITVYDDPRAFYSRAAPFLLQREADHCLLIGLTSVILKTPEVYPDPYLALIEEAGEVVAACVYTPPYRPVLSNIQVSSGEVIRLLVSDLAARYGILNGVVGPVDSSSTFAELWQTQVGQSYEIKIKERIFQLETVNPVTGVPGNLRRATHADRDLLIRWHHAFNLEALGEDDLAHVERMVDNGLHASPSDRGKYFWEVDGQAVSLAGYTGPTPNGIRVGPVYTPPELRGHGYASACVATMSQILLDEGRKYCFLFTDLSNPTSNHIYQMIGYQPVCDVDMYNFAPAG